MEPYTDKTAIVTGGASGIGKEMCLYLSRRGAQVIIADINKESAEAVAKEIQNTGGKASVLLTDVTREKEVKRLIQQTHREFGRIDLLINNAGIGLDGEFRDMTLDHWRHLLDINLWGVIYGTHFAYPLMIDQGFGQIVNVASIAGLIPGGLMTSYTASKFGVVGLTLGLRAEAKLYGIKVNVLCPGFIETPLHDQTQKVSEYLLWEKNQRNKNFFPTADKVIEPMMRGIEKDRAIIVSPASQKVYWWAYRLFPGIIPFAWRKMIARMKRA